MRHIVWAGIASIYFLGGFAVAAPVAETSAELVSIGIAVGTLTAVVYFFRDELSKRLDRIERRLDSLVQQLVQRVAS